MLLLLLKSNEMLTKYYFGEDKCNEILSECNLILQSVMKH